MARTFKSLFVELVSFLTLFALVGAMTSNFWERYLIQSELSNMKSSLHILKETVYHIGAAYDTLHNELKGLANTNELKSIKPMPKETIDLSSRKKDSNIFNTFTTMVEHQITKMKANKNVGNTAPETHSKSTGTDISKENGKGIDNVEIRGHHKNTSIDQPRERDKNIGFTESKGINSHLQPQEEAKSELKNVTTATRNPLKSTGIDIQDLSNKTVQNCQNKNCSNNNIQRCCKDFDCCEYNFTIQ